MLDVKPLRYFVTLAETRHFGRAAARLNLSQPPLSRQLAALEASLGVTLIERNPRSVVLTAAGERFYQDAKAILASIEQAEKNARAAAIGDSGQLTIGFTMCAAYSVLPSYARAYGDAWPDVTLNLREVVSNDLASQVLSGQIDAAIMFPGAQSKDLDTRAIFTEPLCVALSREHPLARVN
ncbi:LysR substrate binding domain-containing protein [Paraburkholderia steynii]|uniref:LysR substrate binding domain-containing protein n=1 Tax=Paraburkholderia steynii TaxID=1245441 RepID=A0A7Z7BGD4_9BURK|nr:LysR substrate binding domain-containing protein [Paraburkholderia steynii]